MHPWEYLKSCEWQSVYLCLAFCHCRSKMRIRNRFRWKTIPDFQWCNKHFRLLTGGFQPPVLWFGLFITCIKLLIYNLIFPQIGESSFLILCRVNFFLEKMFTYYFPNLKGWCYSSCWLNSSRCYCDYRNRVWRKKATADNAQEKKISQLFLAFNCKGWTSDVCFHNFWENNKCWKFKVFNIIPKCIKQ